MLNRALVFAAVALFLGGAFAGCLKGAPGGNEPVQSNDVTSPPSPITTPEKKPSQEQVNQTLGQRWHFHNYWGLSPNLTLFDGNVVLDPQSSPELSILPSRAVLGAVTFTLPQGRIVPPETGTITTSVWFNGTAAPAPILGAINVSYKAANSANFNTAGAAGSGRSVAISVTPDMTDVPHRGRSIWAFRLTAAPNEHGLGVAANQTVHVRIIATIGRPIFIDPPHLDHWKGRDTLPLLTKSVTVNAIKTPLPDPAYVQIGGIDPANPGAPSTDRKDSVWDFPVVNGSVVPEGAHVVLVRLTWAWTAPADPKPVSLAYFEENSGTGGSATAISDKPGERLYKIPVTPKMTDSPYANQSTWRFRISLDDPAGAFSGTIKIESWVTQLAAEAATFPGASGSGKSAAASESGSTPSASAPAPALPAPDALPSTPAALH